MNCDLVVGFESSVQAGVVCRANLPNRYSALCWRPVTHAQTWASYSTLYRFGRLSVCSMNYGHSAYGTLRLLDGLPTIWSFHVGLNTFLKM